MPLDIVTLENKHLEDAARLACYRYRALRMQVPALPPRYGEIDTLFPMLQQILDARPAVAAVRGSELVGFMAAWLIPSFRGRRASFSPEWGNATGPAGNVRLVDSAGIYEAMYTGLSEVWVAEGYATHLVNTLAHDAEAFDRWPWMGFGMIAADAVRDLSPLAGAAVPGIDIRQAGRDDLDAFMALEHALSHYLAAAPTFLVDSAPDSREASTALLEDPEKVIWLAIQDDRPVAYLLIGSASEDASTIIYDEGTASITGAYTRPEARGSGIATALLDRAIDWARNRGYVRCAVDFEPMNPLARRFWLQHFARVSTCFSRTIG